MRPSRYIHVLVNQSTVRIEVITKETNGTNIRTQFSHIICTGCSCSFLASAAVVGVQMGEISKLG
jgi:hypothetical protein